jgi:hypothetical protein
MAVDNAGNVYVAVANNDLIRKVTPAGTNGVVTTLAGLGANFGSAELGNRSIRAAGEVAETPMTKTGPAPVRAH